MEHRSYGRGCPEAWVADFVKGGLESGSLLSSISLSALRGENRYRKGLEPIQRGGKEGGEDNTTKQEKRKITGGVNNFYLIDRRLTKVAMMAD